MNQNPAAKNKDLGVRTLINGVGALLIALFIFLAEVRPLRWIFATAVAAIGAVAIWEYNQIIKKKGLSPAVLLSVVAVVFYIFAVFIKTQGPFTLFENFWNHAPQIVLGLSFFACFIYFAAVAKPPITNISSTFMGILYVGVPLGLLIRIMYFFNQPGLSGNRFEGSWWVIYLIAVTKCADIGGFFIGRKFGKRKLASKLSPNKTLEGAIGGLIISTLASLLICFLGHRFGHVLKEFSYIHSLWLGLVIGAMGQIGDLAESFLKRDANVKDSNALPGVGGILDMIDSLLFTAPVVYIFLRIIYN